jgi:alpha-1,2-mannosyltransferase
MLVGWVKWLRDADWLTLKRAEAYSHILLVVTFVISIGWIALSRAGIDPTGKPLGTDFVSFWAASKIALSGNPAGVYDMAIHKAQQIALFPNDSRYAAFFYPPPFLLICLPLAALPYLWSLVLWLGVTGFACWRILRAWLDDRIGALPILAFPVSRSVATFTLIPLGPIVSAAIVVLILRRALARERADGATSSQPAEAIGMDSPVYASLTPSKVA